MAYAAALPTGSVLPTRLSVWVSNGVGLARRATNGGRRAAGLAANVILALAVFSLLALGIGPHVFDYRTETMLTGSMVPQINPGDVVVDTEIPLSRLRVGDVVTYHIPVADHRVVSHRVISISRAADGTVDVHTKGDANPDPDPWTATFAPGGVWRVVTVVPKVGHAIRLLRTPTVTTVLHYGAPTVAVLIGLVAVWRAPAGLRTGRTRRPLSAPAAAAAERVARQVVGGGRA